MKFTKSNVLKLKPPAGKSDHWQPDDSMAGFGIRFRSGGEGIYGVRFGMAGRDRRLSYQAVTKVTLADARAWARRTQAQIGERIDPAMSRATAVAKLADTMESQIDNFLDWLRRNGRSAKYLDENARTLRRYFKALHPFNLADVNRKMIAGELVRLRTESGPVAADRSRAHLSKFFGWAIGEGLADANPVFGTNKNGSPSRDRVLQDTEIAAIWQALGDDDYGDICRLLILTGCRREEIGSLSRDEINFVDQQIELPGARTKNGRPHTVPLAPMALAILQRRRGRNSSEFVFGRGNGGFSGWSKSKERLDTKVAIQPWVLHDFRRAISTVMNGKLGIAPHVVEEVLGHARVGVSSIYNRSDLSTAKMAALTAYGEYVGKVVSQ